VLDSLESTVNYVLDKVRPRGRDSKPHVLICNKYWGQCNKYGGDTMIIQAIGLLDDLDKELNTYAMRVREWYGWHFPELSKIVQDNIQYAKVVKLMGSRTNAADLDFSEVALFYN
jgi:RNA processing factor Prp31